MNNNYSRQKNPSLFYVKGSLQETLAGFGSNGYSTGVLCTFEIKFFKMK